MRLLSVFALVVSFALPAAADPFDQLSAHAQAFETAFNAKNAAACAAMYDEDAVFIGPNAAPAVEGRANIANLLGALSSWSSRLELTDAKFFPITPTRMIRMTEWRVTWNDQYPDPSMRGVTVPMRATEVLLFKGAKWLSMYEELSVIVP